MFDQTLHPQAHSAGAHPMPGAGVSPTGCHSWWRGRVWTQIQVASSSQTPKGILENKGPALLSRVKSCVSAHLEEQVRENAHMCREISGLCALGQLSFRRPSKRGAESPGSAPAQPRTDASGWVRTTLSPGHQSGQETPLTCYSHSLLPFTTPK